MDIGLIGFGGVGQALAGLLIEKKKCLREKYNLEINLKYIINSIYIYVILIIIE